MKTHLAAVFLLAAPGLATAADGAPRARLTVDDAIQEAFRQNDMVRAAHEQLDAANDTSHSVRGRLGPTIALQEEYQHYKNAFAPSIALPVPGVPPISFPIHDQNTNTFVVAASQPLVGLFHIAEDLSSVNYAADAAQANEQIAQAALVEAVKTSFLRLFQAKAQVEISQASEQELNEQVTVGQSKFTAGVITKADLLRLQVAAANARQQEIQGKVQEQIVRANILTALGRSPDEDVEFVEPKNLEQANFDLGRFDHGEAQALQRRPEVLQAQAQAGAAQHTSLSKLAALLPEVNAEAAYVKIDGQALAEPNAYYVGIKASWPIWTWGADFFAHRAAAHQATAARLNAENARRQVSLDVSTKLAQARAAAVAAEVAQTALVSAQEAYRVENALVNAGSATTTDLLDSQAALTQARLNLVRAKYDQAISNVALERAVAL